MSRWARRIAQAFALFALTAAPASAQGVSWAARVAAGGFNQGSPYTGENGTLTMLSLEAGITRNVVIVAGAEWSTAKLETEDLICATVPGRSGCFTRPGTERVFAGSLDLRIRGDPTWIWVPYISAGAAWQHSLAPDNPGERGTWVSPQGALGFELGSPVVAATVEGRLRTLDRWSWSDRAGFQTVVLVGLRWRFRAGR
jgi:hypothetical protein